MGLKEMSSERLLVEFDGSIHVAIKLLGKDTTSEIEGIKTELLSRLEAGQRAIEAMNEKDKRISSLTDRLDLSVDEFERIFHLTGNEEIKGICKRSQQIIFQTVPVIQERDRIEKAITAMEQIDKLWLSNLTQDEFDKQLVVILLKYKENRGKL